MALVAEGDVGGGPFAPAFVRGVEGRRCVGGERGRRGAGRGRGGAGPRREAGEVEGLSRWEDRRCSCRVGWLPGAGRRVQLAGGVVFSLLSRSPGECVSPLGFSALPSLRGGGLGRWWVALALPFLPCSSLSASLPTPYRATWGRVWSRFRSLLASGQKNAPAGAGGRSPNFAVSQAVTGGRWPVSIIARAVYLSTFSVS